MVGVNPLVGDYCAHERIRTRPADEKRNQEQEKEHGDKGEQVWELPDESRSIDSTLPCRSASNKTAIRAEQTGQTS